MRILHACEFYPPSIGGAQEVMRQLSEHLSDRGHDVTVATSRLADRLVDTRSDIRIKEFNVSGNLALGLRGDVSEYREFVKGGEFDVVLTYAAQQWTTDALIPVLDTFDVPVVLAPCGFSGLRDPRYASYFNKLSEKLNQFSALVFHSTAYQDIEFVRQLPVADEHFCVIPNGADEREFMDLPKRGRFRELLGIEPDRALVISVGGHTGLKGHAEAMKAFASSDSMHGGSLALIANRPTGRGCAFACRQRSRFLNFVASDRRIVTLDPTREVVLQAYADADVFLFCSAVECSPLVLFESMAAGLPFVSVDVGNASEIASWGECGVIVPSTVLKNGRVSARTADIAMELDGLMADSEARAAMSKSGRSAWKERFTWAEIARSYEDLYLRLSR